MKFPFSLGLSCIPPVGLLPGEAVAAFFLPLSPTETPHHCFSSSLYCGKEGEKVRASILFTSIFSFYDFALSAEGLNAVIAAEEPHSACIILNTLVNQSSHSYEEMLFKNPVLNLSMKLRGWLFKKALLKLAQKINV